MNENVLTGLQNYIDDVERGRVGNGVERLDVRNNKQYYRI